MIAMKDKPLGYRHGTFSEYMFQTNGVVQLRSYNFCTNGPNHGNCLVRMVFDVYFNIRMGWSLEGWSKCSSIFFSALTEGHCTPPGGRVGSIRYVDYHRPLLRCLLSAFSGRVLSLPAGVNYLP